MNEDSFFDFLISGGDELLNNEACPHCGDVIYLDQKIEWVDEASKIAKCPGCGGEVKVSG
jgi:predicted RNA-binding Zn-ribbon protein involved in translation (DUF1610 family)